MTGKLKTLSDLPEELNEAAIDFARAVEEHEESSVGVDPEKIEGLTSLEISSDYEGEVKTKEVTIEYYPLVVEEDG